MNIGVGGMPTGAVLPLGPGVIPGYQTAEDLLQGARSPAEHPGCLLLRVLAGTGGRDCLCVHSPGGRARD